VRVWDLESGSPRAEPLRGHKASVAGRSLSRADGMARYGYGTWNQGRALRGEPVPRHTTPRVTSRPGNSVTGSPSPSRSEACRLLLVAAGSVTNDYPVAQTCVLEVAHAGDDGRFQPNEFLPVAWRPGKVVFGQSIVHDVVKAWN
jgi:hypothetical protein